MTSLRALELLARAGFIVKGVLYIVVGTLALQVAGRLGGRVTGTRGALTTVLAQPFGRTMLLAAAIGLFGYATWRVLQGILDPDRKGSDWIGVGKRISYVVRGVIHAAIGLQALRLYRGLSSSGSSERRVAGEALQWPFGDWLLVLAGVGLIALAVQQMRAAIINKLERNFDVRRMQREAGNWAVMVARFGVGARAVVFGLLGWGVAVAGWFHDPSEVRTTASSLQTLAGQPGGRWLLAVTAAGFVAYGIYQFLHARYLQIRLER